MSQSDPFLAYIWPYLLALAWGIAWAMVLQWTRLGRYLAVRRTWITVVIGVGVDLLIALAVIPFRWWLCIVLIIVLSGLGIIARSLINEHTDEQEQLDALKTEAEKHIDLGL